MVMVKGPAFCISFISVVSIIGVLTGTWDHNIWIYIRQEFLEEITDGQLVPREELLSQRFVS